MHANNLEQDKFEFRGQVLKTRQTILLGKLLETLHLFTELHERVQRCKREAADLQHKRYADDQFSQFTVKLRNHPLMCYHGRQNWPPLTGTLKHAIRHEQFPNKCFLVIECNGQRFITPLIFPDSTFCEEIYELLQHQCGHTIEEIGELNLIRTLDSL
jgi:hypothetical protein